MVWGFVRLCFFTLIVKAEFIELNTEEGKILGQTFLTEELQNTYYAFQGIPYAEKPHRFQEPVQKMPWNNTLNCTYDRDECVQGLNPITGSEDCLYLSVYSRNSTLSNFLAGIQFGVVEEIPHAAAFYTGRADELFASGNFQQVPILAGFTSNELAGVADPNNAGAQHGEDVGYLFRTYNRNTSNEDKIIRKRMVLMWSNFCKFGKPIPSPESDLDNVNWLPASSSSPPFLMNIDLQMGQTANPYQSHLNFYDTQIFSTTSVTGSEDCLYLSVFSPNLTGNAPVLFWIHGGAFIAGSISFDSSKPDHFINQNVVVVTAQYRLGIFGFMSTGDLVCPGNLGLKDQVMALDWTRRNIQHFGGNPNDITIGGLSAGAGSVGYHLLSPKSKAVTEAALANLDLKPWNLVPASINLSDYKRALASAKIKAKFFNISLPMSTQVPQAIQFFNVDLFGKATDRLVRNVGPYVNCYYYSFNYQGTLGGVTMRCSDGAQHGEDLPYLFITNNITPTYNDLIIVQRMTTMWSNFIKRGDPTPDPVSDLLPVKWLPSSVSDPPLLMKIDLDMGYIAQPYLNYYSFYRNQIFSLGPYSTTY
ncbi:unnamed protein product [Diabrotica balteata]|uniref:Carboxylic ester hydrolase n=1 Tax=Diabrotica balteata TaxID=107213 RepID=A0A9N9TCJ2_DIABA|nr:unnamed protein product [Diabrotica balteata]